MIDRRGLAAVARQTGIARESLARYLAAIHVQTGTFRLIESTLSKAEPVDGGR
jgi:DNA-binding phage protein